MSTNRIAFGIVFLILAPLMPESLASASNGCIDCHRDSAFFAQYPKLHEYYQQWIASPHQEAGVTCDNCHGGDPSAGTAEAAHFGISHMSDPLSTLHYQKQPETCGQCHGAKKRQFLQSKHYQALSNRRAAPTCSTCHPAMSRRPELREIVLNACRTCHAEDNTDGLPLITEQAQKVFGQLNIAGGLLGWTKLHFQSHDWPKGSRQRVADLQSRYQAIVDRVHQFDLQQTADETVEILGELREIFDEARSAHDE